MSKAVSASIAKGTPRRAFQTAASTASFEKKPDKGQIPESASVPTRNTVPVCGRA